MELKLIQKNNENILTTVFYGKNRSDELTNYHKKVCEKLKIPVNYIPFPFEQGYNHAAAIDWFISKTHEVTDYWIFLDNDSIPLREDFIDLYYSLMVNKETLVGCAGQSNHLVKQNGQYNHPYCYTAGMGLSKELYIKLGCPSFQPNDEGDTGESLTWLVERNGFNLSLFWPKSTEKITEEEKIKYEVQTNDLRVSPVGQHWFGFGTTYGKNVLYHQLSGAIPRSKEMFINKCNEILITKIEAVIVCKNYGDYLELTLAENHKYFDNIIIVTDSEDTKTQEVCEKYPNVNCWYFTEWNKSGAIFNKGGALNFGLSKLKYNDWVCIMDGDLIIRDDFKDKLIDTTKFYGSYRRFINKYSDYKGLINGLKLQEDFVDVREGSGNGFLQVFNYNHPTIKKYGLNGLYEDSYSATEIDIIFLRKFCPFINNQYLELIRMNIETWHLGPADAQNNLGRNSNDLFFNT